VAYARAGGEREAGDGDGVVGRAGVVSESALPVRARVRLARRLRLLRAERGWSQEALADAAGLHRTYVSSIERGERNVGIDNVERLAGAFGVEIGELFG
jgi:DNA-binding XRE family transcriptional regulator